MAPLPLPREGGGETVSSVPTKDSAGVTGAARWASVLRPPSFFARNRALLVARSLRAGLFVGQRFRQVSLPFHGDG
jgi:hypothetical protein